MSLRPDAGELLSVARRMLLDEVLPALPPDRTYDVLMIANAMAIAGRQLGDAGREAGAEGRIWTAIAGGSEPEAERRVASLIRQRAIPAADEGRLRAALLQATLGRLALSNPKYPRR